MLPVAEKYESQNWLAVFPDYSDSVTIQSELYSSSSTGVLFTHDI